MEDLRASVTPNYATGTNPSALTYDVNTSYSMVEKIARQVIKDVVTDNKLRVFEKMPIDNGTTIEEAVVQLCESSAFSESAGDEFAKTLPSIAVKYYKTWTSKQFKTTVSDNQLRKVMLADGNADAIAERIVSTLANSDTYEHYTDIKGLLHFGATEQTQGQGDYPFIKLTSVAENDYKGILLTIKNAISGLKYVNTTYNRGGIKRKTLASDIYVCMPYTVRNNISVKELSGVFNLAEDEIDAHIIELDNTGNNEIYIFDKNAILDYTRLYRMTSLYNPKALYMNYFLTTDRLYAISPLFDGCFFTLTSASGELPQEVKVVNTTASPVNTKEVTE